MDEVTRASLARLLEDPEALAAFVQRRQRTTQANVELYEDLLDLARAKYRHERVPGDGRFSAKNRSRKVEWQVRALIRGAKAEGKRLERFRDKHTQHRADIAALPEKRQAKALSRGQRREAVAGWVDKSLNKAPQQVTSAGEAGTAGGSAAFNDLPDSLYDYKEGTA